MIHGQLNYPKKSNQTSPKLNRQLPSLDPQTQTTQSAIINIIYQQ